MVINAISVAKRRLLLNNKDMEKFTRDETTFQDTDLLEPLQFYKSQLKDAFHDNAEEYFQKLTDKAQVDIEANREAVKKYDNECKIINSLSSDVSKKRRLKGLFIFLIIFSAIAIAMILTLTFALDNFPLAVSIAVPVVAVGLIVLSIIMIVKQNKLIKNLNTEIDKHRKLADGHKNTASQLMASLNALFEGNMAAHLMSKTTPVIDLDRNFDPEKYSFLHEKYGYSTSDRNDISTLFVQSGNILGNPFIFEKTYHQTMRDHTYTGTLTISWTERVSDGKGGYRTEYRTQTLTAHVTAPEPAYYINTTLVYGNEAAPHLSFSRSPTGHADDDEKKLLKYLREFDKKLDKAVAKDLDDTKSSFTRLHNEEFEALFNALDRDNEMEFRLLFTPLAQRNMVALMKDKDHVGYGDDFSFRKRKELNYITSGHMRNSRYLDYNAQDIKSYSYDIAHKNFVNYCDGYCKEIYFDLAPLICIPLYQQYKTREYIYNGQFGHNITQAEAEAAANDHGWNLFKHPATRSLGVILKTKFLRTNGPVDECVVSAHSFSGTNRTTYVSVYGGDGKYHQVPVNWIEYNPIVKETSFAVGNASEDNYPDFANNYNGGGYKDLLSRYSMADSVLYKKGLFSFIKKD